MCSIFTYILHLPYFTIQNKPNVGKYAIHGSYGDREQLSTCSFFGGPHFSVCVCFQKPPGVFEHCSPWGPQQPMEK